MSYLPPTRDLRVRFDTAQALTRLFYREQAVVLACGAVGDGEIVVRGGERRIRGDSLTIGGNGGGEIAGLLTLNCFVEVGRGASSVASF